MLHLTKKRAEALIEVLASAPQSADRDQFLKELRSIRWTMSTLSREELEKIEGFKAAGKVNKIGPNVTAVKALNEASKKAGAEGLLAALGIEL